MATVEEVKANVGRAGEEATQHVVRIRAIVESMDRTSAMLRSVTAGTNHAQVAEALARLEQAKQRLHEAATLTQGAVEATKTYAAGI